MISYGTYELRPCPFCGGEDLYTDYDLVYGPTRIEHHSFIGCRTCGTQGPVAISDSPENARPLAVAEWNSRADMPSKKRGGDE